MYSEEILQYKWNKQRFKTDSLRNYFFITEELGSFLFSYPAVELMLANIQSRHVWGSEP